MEMVRRIEWFRQYTLPAICIAGIAILLLFAGFPLDGASLFKLGAIYVALFILESPIYYILCKSWNPISPIKVDNIWETTGLRFVAYLIILLPSIAFFARDYDWHNGVTLTLLGAWLLITAYVWSACNAFITVVSEQYKSAAYQKWSPFPNRQK